MRAPSTRRSFLGALASLTGMAALDFADPRPLQAGTGEWDLTWLDGLKGKHKQVFAVGELKGHSPLHVVTNYLDAHREVYGLDYPDVNAVVGVAMALPVNANDALWEKYEMGRLWEVNDPKTGAPATRNVYLDNMPAPPGKVVGVKTLQSRGAIFWQCNNALGAVASRLAREFGKPMDQVRSELLAGMNPGVKLVPAHTMLLGLCQERGCTYEHIG